MNPQPEKKLGVRIFDEKPQNLFKPRSINSLMEVDDLLWNRSGRIYLIVPSVEAIADIEEAGASVDRHGVFVTQNSIVNFEALDKYLPFCARKTVTPILADMIPVTSWGSSLANLLTKSSWDELRTTVFKKSGNRCFLCGEIHNLECHEMWEYHEPITTKKIPAGQMACGVQKLKGLIPVCDSCHETFHLGFANVKGRLAQALSRMAAINRLTGTEIDQYYNFIGDRFVRRNEFGWVLDLSICKSRILTVSSAWADDGSGWLSSKKGQSTMLLGVQWKYPKSEAINEAVSPDVAYYE